MYKMQVRTRRELELVMLDLKRALDYLRKDTVAVCHKGGVATTTLHMTRKLDGAVFYEMNKEIGSNITGLEMGIAKLGRLLAGPQAESEEAA